MRTETEKMCARPEIKLKPCSPIPGRIVRSGNENEKVREVAKRASSVSSSPQYTETKVKRPDSPGRMVWLGGFLIKRTRGGIISSTLLRGARSLVPQANGSPNSTQATHRPKSLHLQ